MIEWINWVVEHKEDIVAIYGCIVALCTAIVKILPSNKTNGIWGTFIKIIDNFSTAYTDSDARKLNSEKE